jgi:predicted negative regulator of RcsB-dependent stress response
MAKHLDLEEQEQLDELKHFWKNYGNLITWALIVVFGAIAGWNGWQTWQRSQATQAAAMNDEMERAVASDDLAKVERAFADMKDKFGRTSYAHQAGLRAAKVFADKGKPEQARAALAWVAEKASDEGYRATARLRLAGLLADAKSYDEALKQIETELPAEYEPLAADRRGDIYSLQGKKAEAKAQYLKAWAGLEERADYRKLVEFKLNALGVDPKPAAAAPAAAASAGAKP